MLGGKLLDMGLNLAQQWAGNKINQLEANAQANSRAKNKAISELGQDAKNMDPAKFQEKWGNINQKEALEYYTWRSGKRAYRKSHDNMTRAAANEKFSGWSNQIESSSVYLGLKDHYRGESSGHWGDYIKDTSRCPSSQKYDSKTGKCV